jgi:hypothetical protein
MKICMLLFLSYFYIVINEVRFVAYNFLKQYTGNKKPCKLSISDSHLSLTHGFFIPVNYAKEFRSNLNHTLYSLLDKVACNRYTSITSMVGSGQSYSDRKVFIGDFSFLSVFSYSSFFSFFSFKTC